MTVGFAGPLTRDLPLPGEGAHPERISVIVPVRNGARVLERCLAGILASSYPHFECIVVDDGSTDDSREIVAQFPVRLVALAGGPRGPAFARNQAAKAANGDVLFFADADVVVHPDALATVAETLARNRGLAAVFGAYDESPEERDFVSQYRNLLHHFVHQHGRDASLTFWSGCGAVRRSAFVAVGGFDEEHYARPSIEDIDLGVRLKAAGYQIMLNKRVQAKHLKRWTLRGMTVSDVFDRAIPWTQLIMRDGRLPDDLNLRVSQRVSALLLGGMVFTVGLAAFFHTIVFLVLVAGLFLLGVGRWCWPGRLPPAISRRAELLTYVVLGVALVAAWRTNHWGIVPFLTPVLLANVASRGSPRLRFLWSQPFFAVEALGLVAAIVVELTQFPSWTTLLLLAGFGSIVLLNHKLYAFYLRKRGIVFVLAVVPYHLFYYFYSLVAFVAAMGHHLLAQGRSHRLANRPVQRS